MRTEIIKKTYLQFNELTKTQQDKVIESLYYINVDHDWWDCTYEDASLVDLDINGFDIDRSSYCDIKFKCDAENTAKLILENHGDTCGTYKAAKQFLDTKMNEYDKQIFKQSLSEDYRMMLSKEYEYMTSEEAIKETIECNDYEFDSETLELA